MDNEFLDSAQEVEAEKQKSQHEANIKEKHLMKHFQDSKNEWVDQQLEDRYEAHRAAMYEKNKKMTQEAVDKKIQRARERKKEDERRRARDEQERQENERREQRRKEEERRKEE